jgi:hypothetical protein
MCRLSLSAVGLSLWIIRLSTVNSHVGDGLAEFTDAGEGDRESEITIKKKNSYLFFFFCTFFQFSLFYWQSMTHYSMNIFFYFSKITRHLALENNNNLI